jgi:hypothetical protein
MSEHAIKADESSRLPAENQVVEIPPPPPYENNVVVLLNPRSKSVTFIGILVSILIFIILSSILFIYIPSIIWGEK